MSGSINTLSKFGVPLGNNQGRGGLLAPKLRYRFRLRFLNFGPIAGGIEMTQQVMSCGRPSLEHDLITIPSYNSTAYMAGKHSWRPIEVELRDDISNITSGYVGYQMQKQLNHLEQTGVDAGINYKFDLYIDNMDGGDDNVLDTWHLEGCFVTEFRLGELAYRDGGEILSITMSIRYDNATNVNTMTDTPDFISGTRV